VHCIGRWHGSYVERRGCEPAGYVEAHTRHRLPVEDIGAAGTRRLTVSPLSKGSPMSALQLLAGPVQAAGYELGSGRLVPTVAAVIGLAGVVIGGLALARARRGPVQSSAAAALVAGLIGVIVGGLHGANAAGGVGTGNGLAGAVAAVVLGVIAVTLALLALSRARRAA
jgi:hypothetical protein